MKQSKIDLTQGSIFKNLIRVAMPIIATSFVQTAYNLTDLAWIGKLGTKSIAGVGTAGFYMWLSFAFVLLSRTGTEILVAQRTGAKEENSAKEAARAGMVLSFIVSVLFAFVVFVFREQLILFFKIDDAEVNRLGIQYLGIISIGMPITFFNQLLTGIHNGRGDSKTPFRLNVIGLIINMSLDPILIHGYGIFPKLGVRGAAIATVFAQGIVLLGFFYHVLIKQQLFEDFHLFAKAKIEDVYRIIKLGIAPGLQSALFTLISMVIARLVAQFGDVAVAVQKVGTQIEAITWMSAGGFSVALGAFVAQNFGAKQIERLFEGYKKALIVATILGVINSIILIAGSDILMKLFVSDKIALALGKDYLVILGLSQLFMFVEITIAGAFNGLGKTNPPAIVSIVFNLLRIPLAIYLSKENVLGINGIWWAITISSLIKGTVIVIWFESVRKKCSFQNS